MKKQTYETRDFYLGCLLYSHDVELIGSHKGSDGVYFEFEIHDNALLGELLMNFSNNEAMVNLKKMKSAMASLRRELDKHKH